ncbi:Symplekin [Auxenochlorella protothecoides]|uniref:Symplekin n=1 Tax=Auxenochlorella protothecoides TaxID=3075 RepID=A0A087SEY6_AUXPR|nr:Symplekin [Auxenochlorella protothecoides]KFM24290.1 Symplekin [Auxenochlorella protothecoides]
MSHAYNQAVQLLEDARLGADAASKASALQSLRELVVHAHPQELMPALLPEILELRLQPESALRRVLPDVIDGVLPTLDSLLQCLMCLTGLLADPVAAVVRRAAQSAHPLFRAALVRVALTPLDAEPALQAQRLPAVPGLSPAPAALPASHAVLTRAGLAQEADAAAREVAAVVRTCDAAPGPMAEAALRAAGALATQRPHFMPRLVPALLSVAARQATMVGETATTSGDGGTAATTESGTPTARDDGKSVTLPPATRKALTAALAQVRRCTHPLAAAWARKVDRALADLAGGGGTQDGAGEACVVAGGRDGAAASKPSQSAPGRPAEDPRPPPAKRPCTEDRATEPAGPALPVESPRADGAELATRVDELVARGDSAGLAALYASLDAESAAELADLAGPFLEELGTDFHARGGVEAVLDFLHAAFAAEGRQDLGGEDEAVTERQQGDGYRAVLSKALDLVRRALPPTDRSLISVLLSAPALPAELLRDTLEGLMQTDLDHATLGLLAARDLILARPPAREVALAAVLAAAHSEDAGVRDRAVRLLTNRLWGCLGGRLQPKILREAERSLRQLVVREDGAAVKQEADGTAAARVQQEADGAAAARVKAEATDGAATTSEDAGVEARADTEATAVKRELGEGAAPSVEGTGSVVDPAAACALFCALCTRQPGLLPRLFEAFGSASASGREGILKYAGGLATTLGPTSRDLLGALADLPENCMDLALGMLHALASALPALPEGLVRAAADLAQASCDARPLVPLLRGLGREGLLARLPLLLGLPGAEAGAALRGAAADRLVPPSELLVALHGLDPVAVPGGVRAVMAALGDCLADPDAFPAEAVAGAISALLTRVPLPPLLLRTALQAQASGPGLAAFVARTVLPALAEGRLRAARADLPPAVAEGLAAHALRETHALPRETVALFREG